MRPLLVSLVSLAEFQVVGGVDIRVHHSFNPINDEDCWGATGFQLVEAHLLG